MNLVLDWGNTRLKASLFSNNKAIIINTDSIDYEKILIETLSNNKINNIILSSVIDTPKWLSNLVKKYNFLQLNHKTPLPISIDYTTPETLGNDRLANAVAGTIIHPNENVLVIDVGTCLKFDYIDADKRYLGGSISPGFSMRLNALHSQTDRLPLISKTKTEELIGDSSKNSILSGVYFGMLKEIEGIINEYKARYKNLKIIITGGDAFYFEKALKTPIFAHSFLTLYGLNEILDYNAK